MLSLYMPVDRTLSDKRLSASSAKVGLMVEMDDSYVSYEVISGPKSTKAFVTFVWSQPFMHRLLMHFQTSFGSESSRTSRTVEKFRIT